MESFASILWKRYGDAPFRATDVLRDLPSVDYPPTLRYRVLRGASPQLSIGRVLTVMAADGSLSLEVVEASNKHGKLYRMTGPVS